MKHLGYNRFFPTPKYLEMGSVGIDISDRSIKYASLSHHGNTVEVGIFGEKKVPEGVIESGKIKNRTALLEILMSLKKEQDLHFVRASLPEEQMYLFQMGVPKMTADEIRGTIELQMEEHVPLTLNDALFDYEIIEENNDSFRILVIVAPNAVVDEYILLFQEAGLELLSLELEASALARAIIPEGDEGTHMIIDFGDTRSGIAVVHKRLPLFTSTIPFGGAVLTSMISKTFNISFDDAEKMKKEIGLSKEDQNKELFSTLLNGMSVLRDEVNRNFIYWHTHKDEEGKDRQKIESIILCGGNANLAGLADYLKASLRTNVKLANVWSNINTLDEYIPPIPLKESLSYATSLGLALGDISQ